jgi:2-keto-4-pentenoate hydratase
MQMTESQRNAALALRRARIDRTPIARISETHGIAGVDAAYAIAAFNVAERVAGGARLVGKKVGLTSRAVQQQLGVNEPDFGILFDDMQFLDGDAIPMDRLVQPKAEAEVAFIVTKDLTVTAPTYGEFISAIGYAVPALEIVDSAIKDWNLTLVDTVADNASCGLFVLGNQPLSLGQVSLGELGLQFERNGRIESVGSGAACLAHPLRAAYWLSRTMAERGDGLRTGEVILSGALGPMVAVKTGDYLQARIGSLGSVSCHMV